MLFRIAFRIISSRFPHGTGNAPRGTAGEDPRRPPIDAFGNTRKVKDNSQGRIGLADQMLFIGLGLAGVYWIIESILTIFLSYRGSMAQVFVGTENIWSRLVVLCLFVIFGSHAQYAIKQREKAERHLKQAREEEMRILELTTVLSSELNLDRLLSLVVNTTTELLDAERCSIFIHDRRTDELWSRVARDLEVNEIRFPSHMGIAGSVFTSGKTINISNAYLDPRFNPQVDQKTGYKTRSVLCVPIRNKAGRILGVTQVLNKAEGEFTETDERRLKAFTAQAAIALENAGLYEDTRNMKNYNESLIESMSSGIVSLDADKQVIKYNSAATRILCENLESCALMPGQLPKFFGINPWVPALIDRVLEERKPDFLPDVDLFLPEVERRASVNLTVVPLVGIQKAFLGSLLILEDINREKRLKSTIARYMTKEVAEKLFRDGENALGGQAHEATIMFSDIRNFTALTEVYGPRKTLSLLNDYFGLMVDIIFRYGGILDKYIGDALLAVFGAPYAGLDDPDNAATSAIEMMRALDDFNRNRTENGSDPIGIGIGINTDEVISGNIGSLKRMDYTVIGDGVNLASRLERANKIYGTHILVSEFTVAKFRKAYALREIDRLKVKGRDEPVSIHEILDHHTEKSFPHLDKILELFREGLSKYRSRQWTDGAEIFREISVLNPADTVSGLYLERCRRLAEHPPGPEWDGTATLETP